VGYSVAGYETALLGTMLESAGVSLTDVKLVNVNFALTEPLLGGQVDAVVGAYRNVEFYEMQLAGHPARLDGVEGGPALSHERAQNEAKLREVARGLSDRDLGLALTLAEAMAGR